ncbi:MAG: glycosyltransferase [Pseudomonadota bacterium]
MSAKDISVVLTAHNETTVAGPTMRSAEAAIDRAQREGLSVEAFIALDAPTEACHDYFTQAVFDGWQRIVLDERDLGRTRNTIVPQTVGRFIAFLDADDLFSENWLSEGGKRLGEGEMNGEMLIAHPELNWLFDGATMAFAKPNQDDPVFVPHFFYFSNYYDSLCLAPRQAHLEIPYVHRDIPNGLSFQDWQFSIETMAAGWKHVAVKDTIIFKRRRDSSLVTESGNRNAVVRALEAMAIDHIAELGRTEPVRQSTRQAAASSAVRAARTD